jgi:hypothetical protein
MSLYCKSKSAPTKVVDLVHRLGITTSYRWATMEIQHLSDHETESLRRYIKNNGRILLMYDNVRIPFQKETQRVNNQTHGDNGTSITAIQLPENPSQKLRQYGELYTARQLELGKLSKTEYPSVAYHNLVDTSALQFLRAFTVNQVIRILFNSPAFEDYQYKDSPRLSSPPPIHLLPTGRENRTKYWMVGTWPIEESSYDGNSLVLSEVLKHNNGGPLDTAAEEEIAKGGIPLVGDQLTVSKAVMLSLFRQHDRNPFDRMSWLIPTFGWFHTQMLLAKLILNNHRGTHSSYGLARDIGRLSIKGLASDKEKPYYHTVDELLLTEAEARTYNLWLWASGCKSLEELRDRVDTPDGSRQIQEMAQRIVNERASTAAGQDLDDFELKKENKAMQDPVLRQAILLNRDVLLYAELRDAVRQGDVGHLEYLIPTLAMFFKGSGSGNYSKLMISYLQWKLEAPVEIK